MSDKELAAALIDRVRNCTSGDIVAAANELQRQIRDQSKDTLEQRCRDIIVAFLEDGWAREFVAMIREAE
jgi:hypothetical protein